MRRFVPPVPTGPSCLRLVSGVAIAVALAFSTIDAQIPGRNVNIVSGTSWPNGDPFLQRQNEPSIAASTRNPLHLLGGSNDYRTVDIPGLCQEFGPDPEDPTKQICIDEDQETGDAWLGLFKSFDGGQRWISTLLPGYPQDQSPAGLASPLKTYQAGADPVVRAGTHGLIYFSGLVFDRTEDGKSAVFLSRFIDNNNLEAGDPFAYLGTSLVAASPGPAFYDKPWMTLDIPRGNPTICKVTEHTIIPTAQNGKKRKFGNPNKGKGKSNGKGNGKKPADLDGQNIPAGAVYVVFSSITGGGPTIRSEIMLTRSMDCGATWSTPMRVSRAEDQINQGASLTIDPRNGNVYVSWRRFDPVLTDSNDLDAIMVARVPVGAKKADSAARVHKFPKPKNTTARNLAGIFEHRRQKKNSAPGVNPKPVAEDVDQFDLGTTGFNFRTNAYPTMTADGTGRIYMAWTQRGYAANSDHNDGARIVIATTPDGKTFTTPQPIDDHDDPGRGHQLMPSMTFAGGKLMMVFYDLRETRAMIGTSDAVHDRIISDFNKTIRHTIDIRSAMASPGAQPAFPPSVQVSDYLLGVHPTTGQVEPLQVNPPNLPMFKLGTVPFMGDYIDVAAAPAFIPLPNGKWGYNTADTGDDPVFHAAWTDNRDVRPPRNGDWTTYTPAKMSPNQVPGDSIFLPGNPVPQCVDGVGNPGSRNQNVYSARITGGLLAGSPGNTKPLSPLLQRGFVVFAQNTSAEVKSFRMTILNQPPGGRASFLQFPLPPYTAASPAPETAIEMIVPARSTATRTVYVTSTDPDAQINVAISELVDLRTMPPDSYSTAEEKDPGVSATVLLNPDIENPDIENPDIENPDIENPDIENAEVYNPDIENPDIENPDIENPDIENPDIENPDIENPDIENPDIENVRVANPDIENPDIENPDIENPDIENPDIENPDIENPDIENGSIADVTWKVTNTGNTTAAFNVNLFLSQQNLPTGVQLQLILLKTYRTPVTVPNGCQLGFQTRNILLTSIRNPVLVPPDGSPSDPNDPAESNATLWLAPGEEGRIVMRVIDDDTSDNVGVPKLNADGTPVLENGVPKIEYIDARLLPGEDVTPGVQQQSVNTEDAEDGVTEPPVVPPPAPAGTNDEVWTSPLTPVRINVLGNDAALLGSTKVITTHQPGLAQNMGFGVAELVYMPSTGLLYAGSGRTVGVIDPLTNHLVGRLPIAPGDPGATYGVASPQTGTVFFRMGSSGNPSSTVHAYDARPSSPTFHQSLMLPEPLITAIDALGGAFTMALDPTGRTLYYVAGTVSAPAQQTVSAIDADPASPGFGGILWTVSMPPNARVMHVQHNPANGKLYIAAVNLGPAQGGVYVMDTAAPAAPVKIAGTDQSISLAVNPASNLVFAAGNFGGNYRLNTIDGASDTLLAQVAVISGGTRLNNAEDRLVVHHATGKVYLRGPTQVFVFDGNRTSPNFNTLRSAIAVGPEFGQSDLDVDQQTGVVASVGGFRHSATFIDTLSLVDAVTTVAFSRAAADLALDVVNHRVFAADTLNSVHTVNAPSVAALAVTASLAVAPEAAQVLVNPVTARAYASATGVDSGVAVLSSAGLLGSINTPLVNPPTSHGRWGFGVRYDATNIFFFTNSASDITGSASRPGALMMIDGATDTVTATVATIAQPFGAGINQATGQIYVAGLSGPSATGVQETGKIRVHGANNPASWVDVDTSLVAPMPPPPTPVTIGFGRHVAINPDTGNAYVMVLGGSDTSVVSVPSTVFPAVPQAQPITLSGVVGGVSLGADDRVDVIRTAVFGPGDSRIYLGLFNAGTNEYKVVALDGATHNVVAAYAGGGHSRLHTASWIVVNAISRRLYVVDYNADTVTMLDAETFAVLATTTLPDGPSAAAFNALAKRLYVSSIDAKTITALDGGTLAITSSVALPLQALFLHVSETESRIYTSGGNSPDEAGFMVVPDVGGVLGSTVRVTSASTPAGGTAIVNADFSITYTPQPGFSGDDTFTYSALTPAGVSTATVNVHVLPVTAATLLAVADAFQVPAGAPSLVISAASLLANDVFVAPAVINVVTAPAHGTLVESAASPGGYDYVPAPGYSGPDSFQYQIVGATTSNATTVSLFVHPLSSALVVTNTGDSGPGSLRAAVTFANGNSGLDTITFSIPGAGAGSPAVINLLSALPTIASPVVIDGASQPGYAGQPIIELSGTLAPGGASGLVIGGGDSTIRGLSITGFPANGITISGSSGSRVEDTWVGIRPQGTSLGNANMGVYIVSASNNTVTGSVVSASGDTGVFIYGGANGNTVENSWIGTDPAGTAAAGNRRGIVLEGAAARPTATTIRDNVIAGQAQAGIEMNCGPLCGAINTQILNNKIGLGATGEALPNGTGISVLTGPGTTIMGNWISSNTGAAITVGEAGAAPPVFTPIAIEGNLIGTDLGGGAARPNGSGIVVSASAGTILVVVGGPTDRGNIIRFNTGAGVSVLGTFTSVSENWISDNGGLGIDLGPVGVTPNDPGDGDAGPNNLQNFPTLTFATNTAGPKTRVGYNTLDFAPGGYTLRFYSQPSCDSSGHGEGGEFQGSLFGISSGVTSTIDLNVLVPAAHVITATATDPGGNTSEFSACIQIDPPTMVVNTNDSGPGSLRQAIITANAAPGAQTISFNIPGAGPGSPALINLTASLPQLAGSVIIDGTSQPGWDGQPVIQVRSPSSTAGMVGFDLNADNVTIKGLSITNFAVGIRGFQTFSGHLIEQNLIGTTRTNATGFGNGTGLDWLASTSTIRNNTISGNSGDGLSLLLGASGNIIQNNRIGVGTDGLALVPNAGHGVILFDGPSGTMIEDNLISGNGGVGIALANNGGSGPVMNTRIRNNTIGLDAGGNVIRRGLDDFIDGGGANFGPKLRGNIGGGIEVVSAPGTIIGELGQPNVISGNTEAGIRITGTFTTPPLVQYNTIGTDATGLLDRGNTNDGVRVDGANDFTIGGIAPSGAPAGNLISANLSDGVIVNGNNVRIESNVIGLAADGTALGNGRYVAVDDLGCCHAGVTVTGGSGTIIGGTMPQGNIISGNHTGIWVGTTTTTRILSNQIGLRALGSTDEVPNRGDGVALLGAIDPTVSNNRIVGSLANAGLFLDGTSDAIIEFNEIYHQVNAGIIMINAGGGNRVRFNSIYDNGGLGIDLGYDGVTANDSGDIDGDPNGQQNHPVLSNANNDVGATTRVTWDTTSFANTSAVLHFYASPNCDATGFGEGKTFVGMATPTFPSSGQATLDLLVPAGHFITATATNPSGDTSEFSNCTPVGDTFEVRGFARYSGTSVDGVTIELIQGELANEPYATTTTNADGFYRFEFIPPGNYQLRWLAPDNSYIAWAASGLTVSEGNVTRDVQLIKRLTLSSPASQAADVTARPTLTWQPNPEATTYKIQINETVSWELIDWPAFSDSTSYTLQTTLEGGKNYTWQVTGLDVEGRDVAHSDIQFNFTVIDPIIAIVSGKAGGLANPNCCEPGSNNTGEAPLPVLEFAAGQKVWITASGGVSWLPDSGTTGPDGIGPASEQHLAPGRPAVSLLGRIGESAWFFIGAGEIQVSTGTGGTLELAVNDSGYNDNAGSWTVVIRR